MCTGLDADRCTPGSLSLFLERFLEAPKFGFVSNDSGHDVGQQMRVKQVNEICQGKDKPGRQEQRAWWESKESLISGNKLVNEAQRMGEQQLAFCC